MRVVFCGSGSFAAASLQAILDSGHEVAGVATQPARRAGRGGLLRATPIAALARGAGLTLLETPDVNSADAARAVRKMRPHVICVVEFAQMIREPVRRLAELDTFNLHASVLPELRGAAPINWAIIRGYRSTGVTTFSLVDRVDAGEVYLTAATPVMPDDTALTLRERLAEIGAGAVVRTLELIAAGARPTPQDEGAATLAPRLGKADGCIRWDQPAEVVRNLIHGTWPWPGGQGVLHHGGRLTPVIIASASVDDTPAASAPGTLEGDLSVATGAGRLRINAIKPAGKRLMQWRDFVNGFRPVAGDSFKGQGDVG